MISAPPRASRTLKINAAPQIAALRERVGRGVAPVSSTLRTRHLVVPSPPHPNPLPRGGRVPEVPSSQRVIANSTVLTLSLFEDRWDDASMWHVAIPRRSSPTPSPSAPPNRTSSRLSRPTRSFRDGGVFGTPSRSFLGVLAGPSAPARPHGCPFFVRKCSTPGRKWRTIEAPTGFTPQEQHSMPLNPKWA